jgi:hypothetical protein
MTRTIRVLAASGIAAAAFAAIAALPAAADPLGQCPAPYGLGGLTGPVSIAADQNGNNDGYVCRLPFPAGANEGTNNIIDNVVPLKAHVP